MTPKTPSKKVTKSVSAVYTDVDAKKGSTRFNSDDDNAPMRSAYIPNDIMAKLGNPEAVKITVEVA